MMGPQIQPTHSSLVAAGTACQPRAPSPYPPKAYIQIKNNLLPVTKTGSSKPKALNITTHLNTVKEQWATAQTLVLTTVA